MNEASEANTKTPSQGPSTLRTEPKACHARNRMGAVPLFTIPQLRMTNSPKRDDLGNNEPPPMAIDRGVCCVFVSWSCYPDPWVKDI
ncbi:hypothetical protein DPEC_G00150820 [Dallia pectoralis]|uniref:Uncharacterized protein n=1 Tax=Dallia pectoralis TaxID=75939 RepID=A0ACC2GJ87_DALPE|nr:hypothetical protein DPEC_G00150820 [Dallia pectoralis]